MRKHSGLRPYKCFIKGCTQSYSLSICLKKHLKTHNMTRDKFVCTICFSEYTRYSTLLIHLKIHNDLSLQALEKPNNIVETEKKIENLSNQNDSGLKALVKFRVCKESKENKESKEKSNNINMPYKNENFNENYEKMTSPMHKITESTKVDEEDNTSQEVKDYYSFDSNLEELLSLTDKNSQILSYLKCYNLERDLSNLLKNHSMLNSSYCCIFNSAFEINK